MKKFIYSVPLKATAIILSLITAITVLVSVVGIIAMIELGGYAGTKNSIQVKVIEKIAFNDTYRITNYCEDGVLTGYQNAVDIYENTNVRFTVKDMSGNILGTTYNGENLKAEITEKHVTDKFINAVTSDGYEYEKWVEGERVAVTIHILEEMYENDKYYYANKYIGKCWDLKNAFFWFAGIGLLLEVALWIYLFCAAGRCAPDGELKASIFGRIPFDILIAAVVVAISWVIQFFSYVFSLSDIFTYVLALLICIGCYILAVLVLMSFASQIKRGVLIRETIICRILVLLYKGVKRLFSRTGYVFKNIPFIWKSVLAIMGTAVLILLFTLINGRCYYTELHFVLWCVEFILIVPVLLYIAVMLHNLKRGGERIASGDLNAKVNTSYMFGDFKRFGESLNHINDGVRNAVDEKMRSERLKTELITNVSHDIKTPLTSIINYVDLIKKQEPENPQTKEYVEVLDRQSIRLKKLIDDLVEASKASSGALSVELAACDVSVLLSQAVGEFDEKLRANNLEVIMNLPEYPVKIIADGRRMWRVFDNLLNNICKYALEGTRVYLDLSVSGGRAYVTFRNISRYPLNISGDELMERFVRGDRSRHTEGSGLGLSIAKSLTELQNGSMDINIDGDLFKVIISFGTVN